MKNEPLSGRSKPETGNDKAEYKAHYHLPGLFEFYELYKVFLPLYREHREYFYDWCDIGSVYGAPGDCLWGGGRVGYGDSDAGDVLEFMSEYGISARLTFSNSLLRPEHLADKRCNDLCKAFEDGGASADDTQSGSVMRRLNQAEGKAYVQNGVIVHSELLLDYLQENYSGLYMVSSTTKVITDFDLFLAELDRDEFRYVVPDFRLNPALEQLRALPPEQKAKVEFLCNECCWFGCTERKRCYETVSRQNLGEDCPDHRCAAPDAAEGYRFSKAMRSPGFIGADDIRQRYLPAGFSQFKIEGRGLGSALVLEFLLYYMTKPEYQLQVREAIYLDNMLDLF